jgi:hypothetical protein
LLVLPLLLLLAAGESKLPLRPGWVTTGDLPSPHATQAAAADERFAYAVSNTTVAKYDRATGKLLGTSDGPAEHLNSAVLHEGKLYLAHSNYPKKPEESEIKVLDPATMKLARFHEFDRPPGSLVWCLPRGDDWWCCFAHYGKDSAKTVLLRMTGGFKEQARWTFPKAVVDDWDRMSASGGVWDGVTLLVSHHHFRVLYRLRLPKEGTELELVEAQKCPFPGQGIAHDPKTGGLVGIDRDRKKVVFARKD